MSRKKDPTIVEVKGVSVEINDRTPFKRAMRDFIRKSQEAGIVKECRQRAHYEKPSETRRLKKKAAIRKNAKKLREESLKRKR